MAEFENGAYAPGTYKKGDVERVARTTAEAVKFVWEGYVRQADPKPAAKKSEPAAESTTRNRKSGEESK